VSPLPHERREVFTDPDASPDIGSGLFLILLGVAVLAGVILAALVTYFK
jgi:hypothetical protein